ncbi:hypothetical protein ACFV4E_22610 [Streptomyces hygroscopicus]|uniref:hypothetical protein n=1 Tax=Streptomyces hygroscopicus TaxID=1912 RepID=UPI00368B997E
MQTSRPARPVTSIRPRPAAPAPQWEPGRLFLEPIYADELPYEAAASSEFEDEGEEEAAASFITA